MADGREQLEICYDEAVLPAALKRVGSCVFNGCAKLRAAWVQNSSIADGMRRNDPYYFIAVFPERLTMVGDTPL